MQDMFNKMEVRRFTGTDEFTWMEVRLRASLSLCDEVCRLVAEMICTRSLHENGTMSNPGLIHGEGCRS